METISGARALMKALEKEGVKEVFGLPGGANLPMYDELYKSNIRHILVRHEQSAAHMADGFGRVSRKPGVCFATSGPGATNIITGLAWFLVSQISLAVLFLPVNFLYQSALAFFLSAVLFGLTSLYLHKAVTRQRILINFSIVFIFMVIVLGSVQWGL